MGLAKFRKALSKGTSGRFVVSEGYTCGGPNPCLERFGGEQLCFYQADHEGPHQAFLNYDSNPLGETVQWGYLS